MCGCGGCGGCGWCVGVYGVGVYGVGVCVWVRVSDCEYVFGGVCGCV